MLLSYFADISFPSFYYILSRYKNDCKTDYSSFYLVSMLRIRKIKDIRAYEDSLIFQGTSIQNLFIEEKRACRCFKIDIIDFFY